jgi:integrase/recombinase XerD
VTVLTAWIREQGADGTRILFPSSRGGPLSADAVQHLVAKYAASAKQTCPSLNDKRVSPHVLRHTTAMELMLAGVDRTLIPESGVKMAFLNLDRFQSVSLAQDVISQIL